MTSCAEIDRTSKMSRPLHLELRALDPEPRAVEDTKDRSDRPQDTGKGFASGSERLKDRSCPRVEEHKPAS
ncbi:MAG: hypothetical protein M3Q49_03805 [Actinomycetota bacterium]|jgi:hypothetical protein|nr:hypothetical protein [Actinomycetota bacterium]MDP9484914.1 hypothetical protein [Actinomycetota bacterium]PLS85828.1 MAG: hypothetical protein CYG60_10500 [Actinomycetota bacterium]